MDKAKIGIVTLGHEPYWAQFKGLKEDLMAKTPYVIDMISPYCDICDCGFVDTISSAHTSIKELKRNDVDSLFLILSTYLTSSLAAQFALHLDIPIILVALQPTTKLDYQNTTTYTQLYNDDICALPEICGVFERLNKPVTDIIVGHIFNDNQAKEQFRQWCLALNSISAFKYATFGYLGHTYEGMYDMHTDPTAFSTTFKSHVKMLEMCELAELTSQVKKGQLKDKTDEILKHFTLSSPSNDPLTAAIIPEDIDIAARVSVALDNMVKNHNLKGLAYYYEGLNNNYQTISSNMIIGNSLLTSKGIPLAGEADLKTCAAMLIMNRIGGGGSFAELHPCDKEDNIILIGHDGPHNINISNGMPTLRKLEKFHGKTGSGISVEFSLKTGPISLLSIGLDSNNNFKFISAQGESIEGEIPATGNTNTRCRFDCDVRDFVHDWSMAGPTHHLALGIGHHDAIMKKTAQLLGINYNKII